MLTPNDVRKQYIPYAQQLGDYQKIPFNTVADKLCEAMDNNKEPEKTQYFACVILKFLPYMINYFIKWKGFYSFEDVYDKGVDAVFYQLQPKYRSWQKGSTFYKGHSAQQAFIQTLMHRLAELPYESNLDIHKANYNTKSTDAPVEQGDGDDKARTFGDTLYDEDATIKLNEMDGAYCLIQDLINSGRPVDAITLDTLAFNDTMRHTKTTKEVELEDEDGNKRKQKQVTHYSEFWPYQLVKILSALPDDYATYFSKKYKISPEVLEAALGAIKGATNQKLYKYTRTALGRLAADPDVVDLLRG